MSFILEALKKSEKNRQQNSVPTLDTQHCSTEPVPRKRALWPLLLMAVLLVNAAVLLWLFGPWQEPAEQITQQLPVQAPPATTAIDNPPPPSRTNESPAVASALPAPRKLQPVSAPSAAPAPREAVTAVTAPQVIEEEVTVATVQHADPDRAAFEPPASVAVAPQADETIAASTPAPQPQAAVAPQPAPPTVNHTQSAPEPSVTPTPRVYAISELPGHLQQQLPPLHMSVHAYSEGGGGLIRLNDKIMRVGSYLDGSYRLEEITPDGAIFSGQGKHFLVPRKGL